jgi:hypothetical protein
LISFWTSELDLAQERFMHAMQPSKKNYLNALSWQILETQNFRVLQTYPPPLKGISPSRFICTQKQLGVIRSELFFVLPGSFIFRMVTPLNLTHLDDLTMSHSLCHIQNFN